MDYVGPMLGLCWANVGTCGRQVGAMLSHSVACWEQHAGVKTLQQKKILLRGFLRSIWSPCWAYVRLMLSLCWANVGPCRRHVGNMLCHLAIFYGPCGSLWGMENCHKEDYACLSVSNQYSLALKRTLPNNKPSEWLAFTLGRVR